MVIRIFRCVLKCKSCPGPEIGAQVGKELNNWRGPVRAEALLPWVGLVGTADQSWKEESEEEAPPSFIV